MEEERYLGDGLYASWDGGMLRLRTPRNDDDHIIYLEDWVYIELLRFARQRWKENP